MRLEIYLFDDYSGKTVDFIQKKLGIFVEKAITGAPKIKDGFISISHSQNMLLVGLSDKRIGVDIEKSQEIEFYSEYRNNADIGTNLEVWCLKEAVTKITEKGLMSNFINIVIRERDIYYEGNNYFYEIINIDGFVVAIVSESSINWRNYEYRKL